MSVDRYDAGRQPAGRAPAPGRLALVQAFLNSFWDLDAGGADRWTDADAYADWLCERGFHAHEANATDIIRALELREALRALALANHDDVAAPRAESELDRIATEIAPRAGLTPRFAHAGDVRLDVAGDGPDAALGLVLGIVFAARLDGTWPRLKACPHAHCGWAFYDRSRNRSSQWCSMRICGNRTKGERFRRRTVKAP